MWTKFFKNLVPVESWRFSEFWFACLYIWLAHLPMAGCDWDGLLYFCSHPGFMAGLGQVPIKWMALNSPLLLYHNCRYDICQNKTLFWGSLFHWRFSKNRFIEVLEANSFCAFVDYRVGSIRNPWRGAVKIFIHLWRAMYKKAANTKLLLVSKRRLVRRHPLANFKVLGKETHTLIASWSRGFQ